MKKTLGIINPPTVVPYRGYGTNEKVYIKGQILENRPEFLVSAEDRRRKNIRHMIGRYLSTPIPDIEVDICFQGQKETLKTDELGYFVHWLKPNSDIKAGWHEIAFEIRDDSLGKSPTVLGEVLIVDEQTSIGIISDIDDTVLVSHATQLLRKLRLIFTKNAKTRLPFPGVKRFYSALAGKNGINPIFYVSSSEWNLYDFLVDFFQERNLPKGPFLLQNFKSGMRDLINSGGGSHTHKSEKIDRLMMLFPRLSFILIGDSGQHDPQIYATALKKYPNRIRAIYIRSIGKNKQLDEELVLSTAALGVKMMLINHTNEAYEHAKINGWI